MRAGLATAGLLATGLAACAAGNATGWTVPQRSMQDQLDMLVPHIDVRLPANAGRPVPALILFHGCGGLRQVQEDYAAAVVEAGYAAMIVDSNGARDIGRLAAMTQVCTAQRLWGRDRAADVQAALNHARTHPGIDAGRLALIGWSHGGWTVLEALGYSGSSEPPRALSDSVIQLADQVDTAILVYPYCGFPTRTDGRDLDPGIPIRAILAENDVIAPHPDCLRLLDNAKAAGVQVEYDVWPGLTHAFDEPGQPPDPRMAYDADAAARARARIVEILEETFAQG